MRQLRTEASPLPINLEGHLLLLSLVSFEELGGILFKTMARQIRKKKKKKKIDVAFKIPSKP